MSLQSTHHPQAFEIWDTWSQSSDAKYNAQEQRRTWNGFQRRGISIGTLFYIAQQAGYKSDRVEIQYRPDLLHEMLREAENAILSDPAHGVLLRQGLNFMSRVAVLPPPMMHTLDDPDSAPPSTPMLVQHSASTLEQRLTNSAYFTRYMRSLDTWVPMSIPGEIKSSLLDHAETAAPICQGLVGHPVILPKGRILDSHGLDPTSGLFFHVEKALDINVPGRITKAMASDALKFIDKTLLSEFQFTEPLH
ncbi:unnamed protein product, partial [marine sediment metagenome]